MESYELCDNFVHNYLIFFKIVINWFFLMTIWFVWLFHFCVWLFDFFWGEEGGLFKIFFLNYFILCYCSHGPLNVQNVFHEIGRCVIWTLCEHPVIYLSNLLVYRIIPVLIMYCTMIRMAAQSLFDCKWDVRYT